ncbi:heterokaryon incompatibility protein-domain-containing protein [Apiospora rasikravindrae]|uniref:Heterokaryon incompatibility protein-domain-containing protein n=1 Tax=Apiospora rasikravindrae TaxID=990691 RepID=A0ABR1S2M8_9PEZI
MAELYVPSICLRFDAYKHAPLEPSDSIRLFHLLPSVKRDAPVRFEMRQVKLNKARSKYEALSYVWGDPSGTYPVFCNGHELLVTRNCYEAMVQLRRRHRTRILWIDAVCIDQSQTPEAESERSQQIKIMGQIYESASTVLIWLGPQGRPPSVKEHWRFYSSASILYFINVPLFLLERIFLKTEWFGDKWIERDKTTFEPYAALFKQITDRPWFTRVWTVQEIAFARKCSVIMGENQMPWQHLRVMQFCLGRSVPSLLRKQVRLRKNARSLAGFKGAFDHSYKPDWKDKLLSKSFGEYAWERRRLGFMRSMRDLEVTKPHDKIYGMYSIFQGIRLPDPDYSTPLQQVAQDFTKAVTAGTRSLDMITLDLPPKRVPGMPSWVPDYLTPRSRLGEESEDSIVESVFQLLWSFKSQASGKGAFILHDSPPHKLRVRGSRVATFEKVLACHSELSSMRNLSGHLDRHWDKFRDFIRICRDWCHLCSTLPNNDAAMRYSFKCYLGADISDLRDMVPMWQEVMLYPACHRWIKPQEVAKHSNPDEDDPVTILINYLIYLSRLPRRHDLPHVEVREVQADLNRTVEWAFVLTDNGLTGRAYRTCQKGDQLWLLAGSGAPVVLRPTEVPGEFNYVTPAYFHGIMKGELWKGGESLETIDLV